jgi:hypothetical protein
MAALRAGADVRGMLDGIEARYDEAAWRKLLKGLGDAPRAVVIARPSAAKAKAMSAAEEARVEAQAAELGPEGLAVRGEALAAAVAENETEIPAALLSSLPIPDAGKVDQGRARPHRRVAPPPTRFIPYLRAYLVPLFRERQPHPGCHCLSVTPLTVHCLPIDVTDCAAAPPGRGRGRHHRARRRRRRGPRPRWPRGRCVRAAWDKMDALKTT